MKFFFTFFSILLVVFLILIFKPHHGLSSISIKNITNVTKLPGISLSSMPLEERIPYYKDNSNRFYLNSNSYNYTEFVYAK